jgi:alcohol dehydrogenase class IV
MKEFNTQRTLIVTDQFLLKNGQVEKVTSILKECGMDYAIYDGVNTEPTDVYVCEGLEILKKEKCDSVIAIGGGSPIDTGKAIALMATNPGQISDYEGRNLKIPFEKLPMIAISTTAGTGSEISNVSVILDTKRMTKMVLKNEKIRPNISVCDADFTVTMPPSVTASCGFDALAHAVEGYLSKMEQPLTDMIGLHAIELIFNNIEQAWENGQNITARNNMMLGQLMAGMTFSNASTASIHAMARPLGAHFHVPHGISVAMFMSEVLEFTLPAATKKFASIARVIGCQVDGLSDLAAGHLAVETLQAKRKKLKVPTLREYGIDREKFISLIPEMAKDLSSEGNHKLNPNTPTIEERERLYLQLINL